MDNNKLTFNVVQIDNAYIFQTPDANLAFPTAKELLAHIREALGLPVQGRPKLNGEPEVTNVVALHEVQS